MNIDLQHGGSLDHMKRVFPSAPAPWLDLSTGINPWPYPLSNIHISDLHHLPTKTSLENCRDAMSAAFLCPAETILPTPGSEILIRLLPTVLKPPTIAVLSPSYNDHTYTWKKAGCSVIQAKNPMEHIDNVDCIILCNPNNPDGRTFDFETLTTLHAAMRKRNGWLILDEAYIDLYPHLSFTSQAGSNNLIILKSLGKFYGLAGLRLGALIAPQSILEAMSERLGVWSISDLVLNIGAEVYQNSTWKLQTRTHLKNASVRLNTLLSHSGLTIAGSTDLFSFISTPNSHHLWKRLAQEGIYTRRFAWSESHLRIGIPPSDQAETRLANALNL